MRKLFVYLICLSILIGCTPKEFNPNVAQVKGLLEFNEEIDHLSLISDVENVGLSFEIVDDKLDTSTPGEYTITYKISLKKKSIEKTYTFTVKDTDAPIIEVPESIEILYGTPFIFTDYVKATDERDGDVSNTLHYVGTINTYKVGNYPITIYANDNYGNEATKNITIVVKKDSSNSYKTSICGTYTDISYTTDQSPKLTLNGDNSFELYLWTQNIYTRVDGTYLQYEEVLYLVPNKDENVQFSYNAESNLLRLIVEIDGSLTVDSRSELISSPVYNDTFKK